MRNKKRLIMAGLLCTLYIAACGELSLNKSSSSTLTSTQIEVGDATEGGELSEVLLSSVKSLPEASSPVSSDTTLSIGKSLADSVSGIPLVDLTADDFTGKSYAACDMVNMIRGAFQTASTSDETLCLIKQGLGDEDGIYDGEFHVMDLTFSNPTSNDDWSDHIKFRVLRNANEKITDFEAFLCKDGGQSEYIHHQITPNDAGGRFNMVAIGNNSTSNNESVEYQISVEGSFNKSGNLVGTKYITSKYLNHFGDKWGNDDIPDGNAVEEYIEQTDSTLLFSGYNQNTGSDSSANITFAQMGLEDFETSVLSEWVLTAGAANINSDSLGSFVQGWDLAANVDGNSSNLTEVSNTETRELPEQPITVEFSEAQQYNCDETAEKQVVISQTALQNACDKYELDQKYIECYSTAVTE